jgi:hypothetical protein
MTQGSEAKIYSTGKKIVDNCKVPFDDLPIFTAHRMNCGTITINQNIDKHRMCHSGMRNQTISGG